MAIWLLTKIAIVAGTVYLTREFGVWDSPDTTALIYEDIKCELKPYTKHLMEKYCKVNKESTKPWRESWIDAWNDSIKNGFIALSRMPQYCARFSEDLQNSINHFINGSAVKK
ncbi:hypothetical protein ACLKA6_005397 [Drosophila palustris]